MKLSTILASLVAAFAVGGGIAVATNGGSSDSPAPPAREISGPCDEGKHANDPRCTGTQIPADVSEDDLDGDISGPCDEAENANDPRCTGDAPAGSSGPGNGGGDSRGSGPRGDDDDGRGSGGGSSGSSGRGSDDED